jgi:hypothetical protein
MPLSLRHPLRFATTACLLAAGAGCGTPAPKAPSEAAWILPAPGSASFLEADTRESDLVRRFGAPRVRSASISLGEGESAPGSILFLEDPRRRLEIVWEDTTARAGIRQVRVEGDSTAWTLPPGVTLGSTVEDLERLNGGPFTLTGFGYDYAGTVIDWKGGRLASFSAGAPRVFLRLRPAPGAPERNPEAYRSVQGDRLFASDLEAVRVLRPRVSEIDLRYPQRGVP